MRMTGGCAGHGKFAPHHLSYLDPSFSEGNSILESLNGFILIVNTNSEVFYASRTVEQFIGFHQSDIIHQSVFELIHSEDREEFKKHLAWNSKLPADKSHLTLNEILANKGTSRRKENPKRATPFDIVCLFVLEYSKYLERNFTVRFRCLLDNTSGFLVPYFYFFNFSIET
jgi:aryl hydrocarbon receptor